MQVARENDVAKRQEFGDVDRTPEQTSELHFSFRPLQSTSSFVGCELQSTFVVSCNLRLLRVVFLTIYMVSCVCPSFQNRSTTPKSL